MIFALCGAYVFALQGVQGWSTNNLTVQGVAERKRAGDSKYQRCVNDPELRARLKAQG